MNRVNMTAFGVAILIYCAAPRTGRVIEAFQPQSQTFEQSIKTPSGGELTLDIQSGGDVLLRGWDDEAVRVSGRLGGRSWRDTRIVLEPVEGGVRLRSRQASDGSSSTSHKFEIWVPRRYNVRLDSTSGGITITDVEGLFRGSTASGPIVLDRTRGRAELSTGGGNVRVVDSDLAGAITTGGGGVTLSRVRGDLRASSGSEPAIVSGRRAEQPSSIAKGILPSSNRDTSAVGVLRIRKDGGAIVLGDAPAGADVSTGGGPIRIGRSANSVNASTGGGDIDIGPASGSVRATTGNGNVRVQIVGPDGIDRSVEVSSGLGAVVLELPPDLSAQVELETAYTDKFGRRTRIESDWKLTQEETAEWDPSRGTPRKYLRAHGRIGSGKILIRVSTVNGDISVRRRQTP